MKKVRNIFHKIMNADPMIWGYVMLKETLRKKKEGLKPPKGESAFGKESDKRRKALQIVLTEKAATQVTAFFIAFL